MHKEWAQKKHITCHSPILYKSSRIFCNIHRKNRKILHDFRTNEVQGKLKLKSHIEIRFIPTYYTLYTT